jgi:hypothetical protein
MLPVLLAMAMLMGACLPLAGAAVTTGSCDAMTSPGQVIDASGNPVPVFGFGAGSDSDSTDFLVSIYLDFSGSGFTTDDLAALDQDSSVSGVGVYIDNGDTDDQPDMYDTAMKMDTIQWAKNQAQITFAKGDYYVPVKTSGSYEWGIVQRWKHDARQGRFSRHHHRRQRGPRQLGRHRAGRMVQRRPDADRHDNGPGQGLGPLRRNGRVQLLHGRRQDLEQMERGRRHR